jgi:GT2 family glycosyltransferase
VDGGTPAPRGPRLGVVAIGRNEGERLECCLASIADRADAVVYVDSGSSDGSPERARARGMPVVVLDGSLPFTAARARNAGFERLARDHPDLEFVQFVDGDCEVQPGWLEAAVRHLEAHPDVAVVCGRRRERSPDASLYNRLVDVEWDAAPGETDACGGDAMVRARAFRAAGGYDASLIAGEDPELCWRIRRAGMRVVRLDREMTLHDAELRSFRQWWRRQVRSGHAYAQAVHLHRGRADPHRARRLLSIAVFGGALPGLALLAAWPTSGASLLLLLLALAVPWNRAYRDCRARRTRPDAAWYASACLLGKLAELEGALGFAWNRMVRGRAPRLIEYRDPDPAPRGRDPGEAREAARGR